MISATLPSSHFHSTAICKVLAFFMLRPHALQNKQNSPVNCCINAEANSTKKTMFGTTNKSTTSPNTTSHCQNNLFPATFVYLRGKVLARCDQYYTSKFFPESARNYNMSLTRTLLVAPGLTTSNKKQLGTKGIATSNKDATSIL